MNFIFEINDNWTYADLMDKVEEVAAHMRKTRMCPGALPSGERYYLCPTKEDFDKWDKAKENEVES
jgi:hypothetical protein